MFIVPHGHGYLQLPFGVHLQSLAYEGEYLLVVDLAGVVGIYKLGGHHSESVRQVGLQIEVHAY